MKPAFYLTFLFLVSVRMVAAQDSYVNSLPHSNFYKFLTDDEKNLFSQCEKCIMPSDVRKDPGQFLNKLIHWIGIVDTIIINTNNDTIITDIYLQQRYWDYIEDYSIQQERMFVSPYGEGYFVFRKKFPTSVSVETLKKNMNAFAKKENLIFAYGRITRVKDTLPILESEGIRIILEENYATNIASYKIVRDKNNNIVKGRNGIPETKDWKFLRVAGPGRNQLGSRLKNSIK